MRRHFDIVLIVILLFTACNNKNVECYEESYFITKKYDGISPTEGERLVIFHLSNSLLKRKVIKMLCFDYSHDDIGDNFLSFKLPDGYKITGIERVINYNATIWTETGRVYQYLKLNNIHFSAKEELTFFNKNSFKRMIYEDSPGANQNELDEIRTNYDIFLQTENLIYYPSVTITDSIRKKISSINREDVIASVEQELNNPNNIMDQSNSEYEKDVWLSYAKKYKMGDFLRKNYVYKIDYFKVLIKIKINFKGKDIERTLIYDRYVGN